MAVGADVLCTKTIGGDVVKNGHSPISSPLTVTVYTSGGCAFCKQAVDLVREVADKLNEYTPAINVVEKHMELEKNCNELGDVTALPAIRVGTSCLVGLPRVEDVESLIYVSLFSKH